MEHLALEILDLDKTSTHSLFAYLPADASITILRTSQVFDKGAVWTHEFPLNIPANAHIFGTAGELHGARLHEQIDGRRARLWVEGLPLYYGYLRLAGEVDVDDDGNVDVSFEGGRKTFDERLEGLSARDVSVGDVIIGVALNRKRPVTLRAKGGIGKLGFNLEGLHGYVSQADWKEFSEDTYELEWRLGGRSWRTLQWPKLVMSHGSPAQDETLTPSVDYTNVQTPYDAGHAFCNVNICFQKKYFEGSEEKTVRGYTLRLAHGRPTTCGGDGETRLNNAPCFFVLHWLDRLFKDLGIHIDENQALDVEDLRRTFMLNWGCHYEEIDNDPDVQSDATPEALKERYGEFPFSLKYMVFNEKASSMLMPDDNNGSGSVLARNVRITHDGAEVFKTSSVAGKVTKLENIEADPGTSAEVVGKGYLAYATGENYPKCDAADIISALESAFGIRFLFSNDYRRVRIVLLRNILRNSAVQDLGDDVTSITKQENSIRGFRMTYGGGTEDTRYYYKGFNDAMEHDADWRPDTTDKHDYTHWDFNASYAELQQKVNAFNRTCYVVADTGNAYVAKVDENEDLLFPSLFEVADCIDAQDGRCDGEKDTIAEVTVNAKPIALNRIDDNTQAVFFGGDMMATPDRYTFKDAQKAGAAMYVGTYAVTWDKDDYTLQADVDIYLREGYQIRLMDNYSLTGSGTTPFDGEDPGLVFGVMRGSGSDAYIKYLPDETEDETPLNDWWEVVPGQGAIDSADTCDDYGAQWDYNGHIEGNTITPDNAADKLAELWPASGRNAPFSDGTLGYVNGVGIFYLTDSEGVRHSAMLVTSYSAAGRTMYPLEMATYPEYLSGGTVEEMLQRDSTGMGALRNLIVEIDSSAERCDTLTKMCSIAYGGSTETIYIDNGVGSLYGRFSLKLRAEKPNPHFDPTQPESDENRRYLEITDPNLRGRGLADQFYKDYSYLIQNARIAIAKKPLTIAQLSTLDDTVRVHIGDVTGWPKKMQVTVSNQTGIGETELEVMYI